MDAAPPPGGWTGYWRITRDEDADAYGVQVQFVLPDGKFHDKHARVPRGEPPFTLSRDVGVVTLHGAVGDRSGDASFVPNASAAEQWHQRLGRALTQDELLCNALFEVSLDFDAGFRALFPEATLQDELEACVFGADLALAREVVATNADAVPRDVTVAAMRRIHEKGTASHQRS
ncbi:MAG: hypothetical protein ABR975_15035 [Vulcanimicrobiaceae bacterium]|jgi:hypothetical protein